MKTKKNALYILNGLHLVFAGRPGALPGAGHLLALEREGGVQPRQERARPHPPRSQAEQGGSHIKNREFRSVILNL